MSQEIVLEAQAGSLAEARSQIESQLSKLPRDYVIISEEVSSESKSGKKEYHFEHSPDESGKPKLFIPENATMSSMRVIRDARTIINRLEAMDEEDARKKARSLYPGLGIRKIQLITQGSYGFLGLGKKQPNQYEIEICDFGVAQVTYEVDARIRVKVAERNVACEGILDDIIKMQASNSFKFPDIENLVDRLIQFEASNQVRDRAAQVIINFANANNGATYDIDHEEYPGARCHAALILCKLNTHTSVAELIKWLHDWSPETRINSALALGKISAPESVKDLLDIALHDNYRVHLGDSTAYPLVRCAAVVALKYIGDKEALEQISLETVDALLNYCHNSFTLSSSLHKFGLA